MKTAELKFATTADMIKVRKDHDTLAQTVKGKFLDMGSQEKDFRTSVDRLNNLFMDSVTKEALLDLEEIVNKKAEKGDIMRLDDQI